MTTTTMTTTMAMEIDTDATMADTTTEEFDLESLSEPLLSFAKQAVDNTEENAAQTYDTLETQLRGHLLELLSSTSLDLNKLKDTWLACWKLCIYLLQKRSDLDRFIRKLPFVLLEDIVDCLPFSELQDFWESTVDTNKICSGILWNSATNSSHTLQYIRLQNALLERLLAHSNFSSSQEFAGTILMDMAKTLPLSDRSALKLWGSVSGRTTEYSVDSDDDDDESTTELITTRQEQEEARNFHQVFWSVQQDMHNPYSISFAKFFQNCKMILAALESKSSSTATTSSTWTTTTTTTSKYLTKSRLLPLQVQDDTFVKHWLTQFLIIEAFCSSQSTQLKTTLTDLSNRAKGLLRKYDASHMHKLQHVLENSEVLWRTWKRNKCKPDMEINDNNDTKALTTTTTTSDSSTFTTSLQVPPTCSAESKLTLEDLQETAKSMALPSLQTFLEPYVDALDPEAGIEAEYHPKNDKLYCWQSLRLLKTHHLPYFGQVQQGDTERMVRDIYKRELNVDIPGEMPELHVHEDYDEDSGKNKTDGREKKDESTNDKDEEMVDAAEEGKEDNKAGGSNNDDKAEETPKDIKDEEPKKEEEESKQGDKTKKPTDAEADEAKDESKVVKDETATKQEEEEPKETTKTAPPSKPLTPFEQAAMEEEAILVAEHEEKQAAVVAAAAAAKSTGTFAAMAAAPKEEPQKKETTRDQEKTGKRKRESTYGSMADDTSKRPRANQGRTTSDQSTSQARHVPGRGGGDDRRDGNWNAGGRGGGGAAIGAGGRGGSAQPPPRRSPPLPPHQQLQQRPVPGRGGRGRGGPGSGRGGRGDDGRRSQRRDTRRRSY